MCCFTEPQAPWRGFGTRRPGRIRNQYDPRFLTAWTHARVLGLGARRQGVSGMTTLLYHRALIPKRRFHPQTPFEPESCSFRETLGRSRVPAGPGLARRPSRAAGTVRGDSDEQAQAIPTSRRHGQEHGDAVRPGSPDPGPSRTSAAAAAAIEGRTVSVRRQRLPSRATTSTPPALAHVSIPARVSARKDFART